MDQTKAKTLKKCLKSIQIPLMIIGYINRVWKAETKVIDHPSELHRIEYICNMFGDHNFAVYVLLNS